MSTASTTAPAEKAWDGDEYLSRPGQAEAGALNAQTLIKGLVASGVPETSLGGLDVLEVGAGVGTVTAGLGVFRSVHALEPDTSMAAVLGRQLQTGAYEGLKDTQVTWASHALSPASKADFSSGTPMSSPTPEEPGRTLPAPRAEYDAALAALVVHHVSEMGPFFAGVLSLLKPGARLVAVEFTPLGDDDVSRRCHLAIYKGATAVEDDDTPLHGDDFRTSYTVESLSALFTRFGLTDVGGMEGTGLPAFGYDQPRGPTIVVWGRKPE